jgi:hypothetical protein
MPNVWGGLQVGNLTFQYQRGTGSRGGTPNAPGSNLFSFDNSGLQAVRTDLQAIIGQIQTLDDKLKNVAATLGTVANAMKGVTGGQLGPGGQQPSTNTAANVSQPMGGGGGGMAAGLGTAGGLWAMGELVARGAGALNTKMSTITSGGMLGLDTLARQLNVASGYRGGAGNTVARLQQLQAINPADQLQAIQTMMQNPLLFNMGSPGQQQSTITMANMMQKLNPTLGAAGAANLLTQLSSTQTQNMLMLMGGPGTGYINQLTGAHNTAQQTYGSLIKAANMGAMTSAQMQAAVRDPRKMMAWTYNLQQAGLSPDIIQQVIQVAAKGGNVTAAGLPNSPAQRALNLTTQQAKTQGTLFENTIGAQEALDTLSQAISRVGQAAANASPGLTNLAGYGGGIGGHVLSAGANVAQFGAGIIAAKTGVAVGKRVLGKIFSRGGKTVTSGADEAVTGEATTTAAETTAVEGGAATVGTAAAGAGIAAAGVAAYIGTTALLHHTAAGRGVSAAAEGVANFLGVGSNQVTKSHAAALMGTGKNIAPSMLWFLQQVAAGKLHSHEYTAAQAKQQLKDLGAMGDSGTTGMSAPLSAGLQAMMRDNPNIKINSGVRTGRQQAALYALKGGKGVARPGHSKHQTGQAADIGPPSQFGWIAANAGKYGLHTPSGAEPWHVEAMGDPNTAGTVSAVGGGSINIAPSSFISQVGGLGGFGGGSAGGSVKASSSNSTSVSATGTSVNTKSGGSSPVTVGAMPGVPNVGNQNLTQQQFAQYFLQSLGVSGAALSKDTPFVMKWMAAEGGNWHNSAKYNPFNTTMQEPGSVNFNTMRPGAGIQAYTSWQEGLNATYQTFTNAYDLAHYGYGNIIGNLQQGNVAGAAQALVASSWDAGHYGGNWQQFVGDPTNATFSRAGGGSRGVNISLNMPIQVVGTATQQDAQQLVQMVMQELNRQAGASMLGRT